LGILGIGAMGGAVARRARQGGVPLVLGWSPEPAERVAAVREGIVDDAPAHGAELAARCDLIVLAGAPAATLTWLETLATRHRSRALLTDMGPAKRAIVARAAALDLGWRFAGSRPAVEPAGPGLPGADPGLLVGATVYVTPTEGGEGAAREIADFWETTCGAHAVLIDAERHDALAAGTAQLAPLVAAAVAAALSSRLPPGTAPGRRVRELTAVLRDAGTPYLEGVWQNRDHARDALLGVAEAMARLAEALAARDPGDLTAVLAAAGRWRAGLDA
jgi:prephenate dehydrogenase